MGIILNTQEEIDKYIVDDMYKKWEWLHTNHPEHQLLFMIAKGSMNYRMMVFTEDYQSDVDVEVVILPTLDDIIRGRKMISETYIMEDNSHVCVRDIRLFKDLLYKQNPAFLELLYSKYYVTNSDITNNSRKDILDYLHLRADEICEIDKTRFFKALKGMMYEKQKALTHPYPIQKDEIEQYGYAAKQFHHIKRLGYMVRRMIFLGRKYGDVLVLEDEVRECLVSYKTEHFNSKYVHETVDDVVNVTRQLIDNYLEAKDFTVDQEFINEVDNWIYKFIEENTIKLVRGENEHGQRA